MKAIFDHYKSVRGREKEIRDTNRRLMREKNIAKKDKKIIPKGLYCYDEKGTCPYWEEIGAYREQERGYCGYLMKGDWDLNKEKNWQAQLPDGTWGPLESASELGCAWSLLWDQVKECKVNIGVLKSHLHE